MKVVFNRFAVCEPLEIVNSEGELLLKLEVNFDTRSKAAGIAKIQETFNSLGNDPVEIMAAVYDLIRFIYGDEGAEGVRKLYGDNAEAISADIMPHIQKVVAPAIAKASRAEVQKRGFKRLFR